MYIPVDHRHIILKCIPDAHVLMDLPELYHFGREGKWFGMTDFIIYMLDGIVQVSCTPR